MPEDDITNSIQSICEQCSGSKHVSFRHLAGNNGSFMCDSCYRKLFPATAMFEASQSSGFMRNTITAISSAINRRVGNIMKHENEEEECHQCLEKGIFRKCCKKFYCRECFFRFSKCPGCHTPCYRSGVMEAMSFTAHHSPSVLAVISSWAISISLMVVILLIITMICLNLTVKKQKTVWNHTCRGWWWQEQCEIPVCIAVNSSASGELSNYFPSKYDKCQLNETKIHVLGNACIFDNELYRRSNKLLGFDICMEREARSKASEDLRMPLTPKFDDQVVVFEDTFDYWLDPIDFNSSVSAGSKWNSMMNAKATDICGYSNQSLKYEQLSSIDQYFPKRESSLVFMGVNERYAETKDLNLEFGGHLQFHLKFAHVVDNELTVSCKTAFSGDVSLKYSLNQGVSWEKLRHYPVWKYRNENFIFIKEVLPEEAWSKSVRFKWEQEKFDPQRDYWAMDDLRIVHQFNSSWRWNSAYKESFKTRHDKVSNDQCCFDSDQCLDFPNDTKICDDFRMFHFHSMHIYVIAACCILLVRKVMKDARVKRINLEKGVTKIVPIETDVCRSFQIFVVCCSVVPHMSVFATLLQNVVSKWNFYARNTIHFGFMAIMITLDFWTLRFVCVYVFRFWPFQLSPEVYLTSTEESVDLVVNGEDISIADIKSIEPVSRRSSQYLVVSSILTTTPISSIMILIKILKVPYMVSNIMMHLLGSLILLRSILGPLWFVRMYLSFTWILTLSSMKRDSMGRALQRPIIHHISTRTALIFITSLDTILIIRSWENIHINDILVQTLLALVGGIIIGSTIGMLRYLPVTCTSNSLLLTTWPHPSFSFSTATADRNSMGFHILSLKDDSLLRSILDGSVDINGISDERSQ